MFLCLIAQKLTSSQMLTYLNSTLDLTVFAISAVPVQDSWIPTFVMIMEISTEHRALNHIPFIYLSFLAPDIRFTVLCISLEMLIVTY